MRVRHFTLAALATVAVGAATANGTRLLQIPAYAQDADVAAAAPAAPVAPTVDAAALAMLKQMSAAYKGLTSYSASLANEDYSRATPVTESGTIQWAKPNRFVVKFGSEKNTTTAVSNGTTLFASSSADKARYLKTEAPQGASALPMALSQSSAGGLLLPLLLGGNDIVEIFGLENPKGTMSLAMGEAGDIAGTPVERIVATRPAGKSAVLFTFALGKDDHLVRQVQIATRGEDGTVKPISTETHSDIKTGGDIAASAFAFTPVAGAKAVESLEPPRYDARLKKGAAPIAFTATDIKGKPLDMGQYKGKVVLLDFWATWCGPCVGEVPNIVANYNKYKAQGFDVVGISLDQSRPALDKYIATNKMPWRQVFDGKGWGSRVPGLYGVRSIPFALLVGRDGKIASMDVRGPALEPAIKAALAQKVPATKKAPVKKTVVAKR
jgi:outer membrane lipoprotein-sorting protein/peroxiredoxin